MGMEAGKSAAYGMAAFLVLALTGRLAGADEAVTPGRLSALHMADYNDRVLEYFGLYTADVHDGFVRRVRYLLASADIDMETNRRIKISGWSDADYQYDDHSLGGFRHWCETDGRRAVAEFLDFHRRDLVGKGD